MNVFIGYDSALEYWRSISLDRPGSYPRAQEVPLYGKGIIGGGTVAPFRLEQRRDFLPASTRRPPLFSECKPTASALENVARCTGGALSEPVAFVVARKEDRWGAECVRCHVHKVTFPGYSFVRLGRGVYVSSPELCFVQMANRLSFAELLLLGFEWCGAYTTHAGEMEGRPPLSSVARIEGYLSRAGAMPGVAKARRALRYLADGSASPKESQLALLLGLPCAIGGYGLGMPRMNEEISFVRGSRKATDSELNYADLYWPEAKVAVEYDSDLMHTGAEKIAHDAARKNALAAAGISVVTVTKKQLMSYAETEKVAYAIARHLGARIRERARDVAAKRRRLRWELLRHV